MSSNSSDKRISSIDAAEIYPHGMFKDIQKNKRSNDSI